MKHEGRKPEIMSRNSEMSRLPRAGRALRVVCDTKMSLAVSSQRIFGWHPKEFKPFIFSVRG